MTALPCCWVCRQPLWLSDWYMYFLKSAAEFDLKLDAFWQRSSGSTTQMVHSAPSALRQWENAFTAATWCHLSSICHLYCCNILSCRAGCHLGRV